MGEGRGKARTPNINIQRWTLNQLEDRLLPAPPRLGSAAQLGLQRIGPSEEFHQEAVAGTGRRLALVQPSPLLDARLPASALAGSKPAAICVRCSCASRCGQPNYQ